MQTAKRFQESGKASEKMMRRSLAEMPRKDNPIRVSDESFGRRPSEQRMSHEGSLQASIMQKQSSSWSIGPSEYSGLEESRKRINERL